MAKIAKTTNCLGMVISWWWRVPWEDLKCRKDVPKSPWKCTSFREIMGAWLLSHLLPQKLVWGQACSVSVVSRWVEVKIWPRLCGRSNGVNSYPRKSRYTKDSQEGSLIMALGNGPKQDWACWKILTPRLKGFLQFYRGTWLHRRGVYPSPTEDQRSHVAA